MRTTPPLLPRDAPCDLCDHRAFELVADRDRRGLPLETVVCRVCGLLTHAQLPTDAELNAYYDRQYRRDYHGEYLPSPHRVVREWRRGKYLTRQLAPYLFPDDRIVEVGCGLGCTIKNLELAGYRSEGIEPGEGFRRFATESLRAKVTPGFLASMPRQADYDVVLLVHVLEHLASPTNALAHLRSMLRPGGRLYVEVPNAGAPHAAPSRMFHYAHIYNFTADTLEMLAEKAQLRVERWMSAPHDKNLCVLLTCGTRHGWRIVPESYARTMQALRHHDTLRYHLRWTYARDRLRTAVGHPCDHFCAARRMQWILNICQEPAEPPERRLCSRNSAIMKLIART